MLPMYGLGAILQDLENEENVEADRRNTILRLNRERRLGRDENDPFTFSNEHFTSLYRLTKEMVHYLIEEIGPHMATSNKYNEVSINARIFAALYFFANGSYQRVIGHSHALWMGQTTVSKYIEEITTLIVEQLSDNWIVFPTTNQEKMQTKRKFMENLNFPGCIGAIDCTHVALIAPRIEEHNYLNRKGFHSKNVQLICDSNLKILNVNARYAGASHDSFIWRNSIIREELENNYRNGDINSWLLGDSGYPQEPWLMTPILNAIEGSPEDHYNTRHCSARNVIERCNGVLKSRFRCIMGERVLRYQPEKVGRIIVACCILHNICTEGRLPELYDIPENVNEINEDNIQMQNDHNNVLNEGREVRRLIIQRYFT